MSVSRSSVRAAWPDSGGLRTAFEACVPDRWPQVVGWVAGLCILGLCVVFAVNAAAAPALFGSSAAEAAKDWLRGPLAGLGGEPTPPYVATLINVGLPAMFIFYCVAVLGSGRFRPRHMFALIAATQLVVCVAPSFYNGDQFIYLEFSRMWGTLGLNPYVTPIFAAPHVDPLYHWAGWPGALSPYGPLFTMLLAPIASLPLAVAYWTARALILIATLGTVWLCGACAAERGLSRTRAMAFLGLNPLLVYYSTNGAHNDVLALLPLLAAILLLLRSGGGSGSAWRTRATFDGREQMAFLAGALLAAGAGVKASALVCAPALLVAARRRTAAVLGLVAGGAVIWLITVVCFGGYLPALFTQSGFIDSNSFGSLAGRALGLGGETGAVHLATTVLLVFAVAATALLAWRHPRDSVTYASWAAFAFVAAVSWQEPWYAIFFIATASCSPSRKLKVVCTAAVLLLVLSYLPDGQWLIGRTNTLDSLNWHQLVVSQS